MFLLLGAATALAELCFCSWVRHGSESLCVFVFGCGAGSNLIVVLLLHVAQVQIELWVQLELCFRGWVRPVRFFGGGRPRGRS